MALIQLNNVEQSLIIILAVLLSTILVTVIIIVYKNLLQKQRQEHQLWHDFVILDSPDQMMALKNSQSFSFDTTTQHQMLYNHPIISNYSSTNATSDTTLVPQSPPPVHHHHPTAIATTTSTINK